MKKRTIYLDNYELDDAFSKYLARIESIFVNKYEQVPIKHALNRISAKPVYARLSSPNYNASAMDGIMVKSSLTNEASDVNPIYLDKKQFKYVDTGDVITSEYDAVIMIEDIVVQEDGSVMIIKPAAFFENIRIIGEDISKQQMIIPSFHRIRAVDIGPLIASKNEEIIVLKHLSCAILPTGSEIVDVSTNYLEDGMIIDSNSMMINGLCQELYLKTNVFDITKDDYDLLKQRIEKAAQEHDIIIINAGSSAGSEDYTASIIKELGEVVVHGIAIKPGKPAILGLINNTIVVGLPGYPVSTYMVFEQVFKPLILHLQHQKDNRVEIEVTLSKSIHSSLKYLEFVRVKIGKVDDKFIATPLARGAGISMSIAEADGILEIAKNLEGYQKDSQVKIKLLKPLSEIVNKLMLVGSHDLIVDVMQDVLNQDNINLELSSTHVGSYSGMLALKNKECNIAPIHILAEDNTYNVLMIKQVFKEKMILIKGVGRIQVLAYQKNNPKQITSIHDLIRDDISYVNRQKGSGTAILLDNLLKKEGISKRNVQGYDFIMPSHFNVASAIKNNSADCGILIKSVADIIGLDYFNLMNEEYDFLIYEKDLNSERIQTFIKVLQSNEFKKQLATFECYDTSRSGEIIHIETTN